jgi:hypothetical protein
VRTATMTCAPEMAQTMPSAMAGETYSGTPEMVRLVGDVGSGLIRCLLLPVCSLSVDSASAVPGFEVLVGEEYDEGHFRTASMPDPEFITGTIGAAVEALNDAAWRWMLMAGYNPMQAATEALLAIGERLPKIPDSD